MIIRVLLYKLISTLIDLWVMRGRRRRILRENRASDETHARAKARLEWMVEQGEAVVLGGKAYLTAKGLDRLARGEAFPPFFQSQESPATRVARARGRNR